MKENSEKSFPRRSRRKDLWMDRGTEILWSICGVFVEYWMDREWSGQAYLRRGAFAGCVYIGKRTPQLVWRRTGGK
jgi:hypothetical protein